MKRLIPLVVAAGMLFVLLLGMGPVPAQATGPCLSSATVAYSGSVVTPGVVGAHLCPGACRWNKDKKCCWCTKKKRCRCKTGEKWNQAKNRCVKKK
ncbi:MAG: hypothetical protein KJ621_03795 [Proteobacteria bacterium]|nr:hypothetical protein [Pseudomonadota bacterium]MBU1742215.1 hypothetical protein [Pseudomonadota bacterium]